MLKKCILFFLLFISLFYISKVEAQKTPQPIYVIVHGAWGGSWAFKKTDSLLTSKGCNVYRPSLTGQGERVHLASPDIGLTTHINDVVNLLLYENLYNVILVGHSYGGMVITGVADRIPERIQKIIYLDAFVPMDSESVKDLRSNRWPWFEKMIKDGFLVPSWLEPTKIPGDVPQSLKTFTEPISLKNSARTLIPAVYILTVDKGKKPEQDDFGSQAERARQKKWKVVEMEADHNPQWSEVETLVEMLYDNR